MLQCSFANSPIHYIWRISYIILPPLTKLGLPFVDHIGHYLSACPISGPLKSFVSYGDQDSTVQGSSSYKCSQEIWWEALNMVAATIPLVTSGLTSSLKLFLYGVTSSDNVPLMWPCLAPLALPSEGMVSSELHWPPRPRVWHVAILPYPISVPHNYLCLIFSCHKIPNASIFPIIFSPSILTLSEFKLKFFAINSKIKSLEDWRKKVKLYIIFNI